MTEILKGCGCEWTGEIRMVACEHHRLPLATEPEPTSGTGVPKYESFRHHRGGRCTGCHKRIEMDGVTYAREHHVFCSIACVDRYVEKQVQRKIDFTRPRPR